VSIGYEARLAKIVTPNLNKPGYRKKKEDKNNKLNRMQVHIFKKSVYIDINKIKDISLPHPRRKEAAKLSRKGPVKRTGFKESYKPK